MHGTSSPNTGNATHAKENMTGIYMTGCTKNGYGAIEVEYLTLEERRRQLTSSDSESLMRWIDLLCNTIVQAETLMKKQGSGNQPTAISDEIYRHTVAARVRSLETEKLFLQTLHGELDRQCRSIGDRIEAIGRQISAERAGLNEGDKNG